MSASPDVLLWINQARRGIVHLQIGQEVIQLTTEQAAGVATKLLVMAALQSEQPLAKVERIVERVTALFATLDAAAEVIELPHAEPVAPDPPPAWACDDCEGTFDTERGLGVHRAASHGVESPKSVADRERRDRAATEGELRCEKCDRPFLNAAGLGRHTKTCAGPAPAAADRWESVDCPYCERTGFVGEGGLLVHIGRMHGHAKKDEYRSRDDPSDDAQVTSLVDRLPPDEPDPAVETVEPAAPKAAHRLADKLQRGHEHATRCTCGWESDWFNYASPASVALREHMDEVAA